MTRPIRLGISTCPNDTFAFHALMQRQVDWRGLQFEIELLDIQELNYRLHEQRLDIAKASFHAALLLTDRTVVLPAGSALGFGVGPLLLAARPDTFPASVSQLTLCPGEHTTGTLLFDLFYPQSTRIEQVVFSEIMPRLQRQQADFGVCIHEGRFTWRDAGLSLVADLGSLWESEPKCPLPLGGILASRELEPGTMASAPAVIRESIEAALAHPVSALPTMRRYAQELSDAVLMQHVELYVNEWTLDLGEIGRRALAELSRRARTIDAGRAYSRDIEVLAIDA